MNNDLNHHSIKQLLDRSAAQIKPATLQKLQDARMHALEHQRAHRSAPALAWLNHSGSPSGAHHLPKRLNWALAILFIACLFSGAAYWQSTTTEHDNGEDDIAILTDDLPLHVYVE